MASQQVSEALKVLSAPTSLTILSLAEPVLSTNKKGALHNHNDSTNALSDGQNNDDSADRLTLAALQADLAHYKDLFSKLRFSYVEQVTKERFLKAIVADQPELVDAAQNAALEEELKEAKAALKSKKVATEEMVAELEALGRRLAQSHEIIQLQTTQLASLPHEIQNLEAHISALQAEQEPTSSDPELNLSLPATQALLADREAELAELERQLSELQSALPRRKREVARLETELRPLETKKREAVEEAKEAQRKRGINGGMAAELEERGRWLKSVDAGLRTMLEV